MEARTPVRHTGAQYLAGLGIELAVIALLARWGTPVRMRYAQEAPLITFTDKVKALGSQQALPDRVGVMMATVNNLTQTVAGQAQQIREL